MCELHNDFRNLRIDRITEHEVQGERFADEAGRLLADYLRAMSSDIEARSTGE